MKHSSATHCIGLADEKGNIPHQSADWIRDDKEEERQEAARTT